VFNFEMLGSEKHLLYGRRKRYHNEQDPLYARVMRVAKETSAKLGDGQGNDDGENYGWRGDQAQFHWLGIPAVAVFGIPSQKLYHHLGDKLKHLSARRIRDAARLIYRVIVDMDRNPDPMERRYGPNTVPTKVWTGVEPPGWADGNRRGGALTWVRSGGGVG
jgi:hypothetical protein